MTVAVCGHRVIITRVCLAEVATNISQYSERALLGLLVLSAVLDRAFKHLNLAVWSAKIFKIAFQRFSIKEKP